MFGVLFTLFGGWFAVSYEAQTGKISSWLQSFGVFPPQPTPSTGGGGAVGQAASIWPHSAHDLDILARTMWGEARNEGARGMQAVANVVMNRYKAQRSNWGKSVAAICQKPMQFSAWNANDPNRAKLLNVSELDSNFRLAKDIARKALAGSLADITGGADHYLNVQETLKIRGGTLPNWVNMNRKTAALGSHTFLRLG